MSNNGPTFTKATYDKKRTCGPVPSPGQRKVTQEQLEAECAETRKFNELSGAERISTMVALALALKK